MVVVSLVLLCDGLGVRVCCGADGGFGQMVFAAGVGFGFVVWWCLDCAVLVRPVFRFTVVA